MSSSAIKTGALVNKKFRELFLPTVLAAISEQFGLIVNGIIVGNLIGPNALTAVSACLPLVQIVAAVGILISTGSTGLIAIASGAGKHKKANYIFSTVLTLGIIFSAVFLFLLAFQVRELAGVLSSVEELRPPVFEYLTMLVVVVLAAWLLSKIFGLNGVWLAFILAEVAGFLAVWFFSKKICATSNGKLRDVYLIEQSGGELLYDVSVKANVDSAVKISSEAQKILTSKGFDKGLTLRAAVALEEMTVNISKINAAEIDLDVRIKNDDGLMILLRDNGVAFNPVEYSARDEDFFIDGIIFLKNISRKINYNRVLSLDQTVIEI